LPATLEKLPDFIGPVLAVAASCRLDEEKCNDLELALEEALVNIFAYAYPDEPGFIDLSCRREADTLVISIVDEGAPFSVTAVADPDLSADILERKVGGLGIHLIKNLMDDVRYQRQGNRNILELCLALPSQSEPS
jgi:anti-sigma regulatory factor (Ser/Thr protein kinase)